MTEIYIGLMSGTSADSIDTVAVSFEGTEANILGSHSQPYPKHIRQQIKSFNEDETITVSGLGQLDTEIALSFSETVNGLIEKLGVNHSKFAAIGSHGQTIFHSPTPPYPFTMQLGDPNIIRQQTGIITVSDFRRGDIARGGQGAPLAPLFHDAFFYTANENRAIINIGGIANMTWLPSDKNQACAYDIGPGNCLIDSYCQSYLDIPYDDKGNIAKQGTINNKLLACLLDTDYLALPAPKSTGRETFNLNWLNNKIKKVAIADISDKDILCTLTHLTAKTIADAIKATSHEPCSVYVCGGGVQNSYLMDCLKNYCESYSINSTDKLGIAPQDVECLTFAWLAKKRRQQHVFDASYITGAAAPPKLIGVEFC